MVPAAFPEDDGWHQTAESWNVVQSQKCWPVLFSDINLWWWHLVNHCSHYGSTMSPPYSSLWVLSSCLLFLRQLSPLLLHFQEETNESICLKPTFFQHVISTCSIISCGQQPLVPASTRLNFPFMAVLSLYSPAITCCVSNVSQVILAGSQKQAWLVAAISGTW